MTDFSRIEPRHAGIHQRLEDWGRWVRPNPTAWKAPAIWNQYRSHAWQWETPVITAAPNQLECLEIERAVAKLPEKLRIVIRWLYVWPWVPVNAVRREVGATRSGLYDFGLNAMDMLKNTIKC